MTTKKKNCLSLASVLLLALVLCAVFLYERSKVAMIIDDEAAWDVRDSLSNATRMKVIILSDGTVARYAGEDNSRKGTGNRHTCILFTPLPLIGRGVEVIVT